MITQNPLTYARIIGCLGSIPTVDIILSLDFFSHSKVSDVTIAIIANFVNLQKTRIGSPGVTGSVSNVARNEVPG